MFIDQQEQPINVDVMTRNTQTLNRVFISVVELNDDDDADLNLLLVALLVFAWFLMLNYK